MNYSLYSIVKKIRGNIEPYGETYHDKEALDNLRSYKEDFELLFTEIADISNSVDSYLYSVGEIGKEAFEILKDITNIMLDNKDIYEYIKEQIKELKTLEILKKYLYYDNKNHAIKMKEVRKSIYNFDYEDLKEMLEDASK